MIPIKVYMIIETCTCITYSCLIMQQIKWTDAFVQKEPVQREREREGERSKPDNKLFITCDSHSFH